MKLIRPQIHRSHYMKKDNLEQRLENKVDTIFQKVQQFSKIPQIKRSWGTDSFTLYKGWDGKEIVGISYILCM